MQMLQRTASSRTEATATAQMNNLMTIRRPKQRLSRNMRRYENLLGNGEDDVDGDSILVADGDGGVKEIRSDAMVRRGGSPLRSKEESRHIPSPSRCTPHRVYCRDSHRTSRLRARARRCAREGSVRLRLQTRSSTWGENDAQRGERLGCTLSIAPARQG